MRYVIDYLAVNLRTGELTASADFDRPLPGGGTTRDRVGVTLEDDGERADADIIAAFRVALPCAPSDTVEMVTRNGED